MRQDGSVRMGVRGASLAFSVLGRAWSIPIFIFLLLFFARRGMISREEQAGTRFRAGNRQGHNFVRRTSGVTCGCVASIALSDGSMSHRTFGASTSLKFNMGIKGLRGNGLGLCPPACVVACGRAAQPGLAMLAARPTCNCSGHGTIQCTARNNPSHLWMYLHIRTGSQGFQQTI